MKRVLVFLLAALLLCCMLPATAETAVDAEETKNSIVLRPDAVTAILNECGKSVFEGYQLYGPLKMTNARILIGVAEDGSVHLWQVIYGENSPAVDVSGRQLPPLGGRKNFDLCLSVAPRYAQTDPSVMKFYDPHEVQLDTEGTYAYFYSWDELNGFRRWSLTRAADGTLQEITCGVLPPMLTLEEAQAGLDAWLESAFPDAGIKAADFDAVRGDDRFTFSTQLKNGQLLDGHYAGTYMAICYDKEQGVTFFSYHEY